MVFIIQPQFPLSTALKFSSSPLKGGNCIFEDISNTVFQTLATHVQKKRCQYQSLTPSCPPLTGRVI